MTATALTANIAITELLFFLVCSLSTTSKTVTAQSLSRSNVFDTDDEMLILWEMMHFTTQVEIAADVSTILTKVDADLKFLL